MRAKFIIGIITLVAMPIITSVLMPLVTLIILTPRVRREWWRGSEKGSRRA